MNRLLGTAAAAWIILGLGCGEMAPSSSDTAPDAPSEDVGQAQLFLTVIPASVQCVVITAVGSSTVTQSFAVTAGASSTSLSLGALPLGNVTFSGQAFTTACSGTAGQTPTWIAQPQAALLQPGVVPTINLTFRPNNPVKATASFIGNVVQTFVGYQQIALVFSDGSVEASGRTPVIRSAYTFGVLAGMTGVAQLAGGANPAGSGPIDFLCAVASSGGGVQCWGGGPNQVPGSDPTMGSGPETVYAPGPMENVPLTGVVQLVAGAAHLCARTATNGLLCWGDNTFGQLGANGTTSSSVAVSVAVLGLTAVAAGGNSTCAIGSNAQVPGSVYCWGSNASGQLGNGTTTNASTPTPIPALEAVTQVVLGQSHGCALRGDGSVRCWGANAAGQLGNGSTTASLTPVVVPGLTGVAQLVATNLGTCARTTTGAVFCWGENTYGELGNGTGIGSTTPVQVPGIAASASISAGPLDVCSMAADSSIACWGDNSAGQLGNGSLAASWTAAPLNP